MSQINNNEQETAVSWLKYPINSLLADMMSQDNTYVSYVWQIIINEVHDHELMLEECYQTHIQLVGPDPICENEYVSLTNTIEYIKMILADICPIDVSVNVAYNRMGQTNVKLRRKFWAAIAEIREQTSLRNPVWRDRINATFMELMDKYNERLWLNRNIVHEMSAPFQCTFEIQQLLKETKHKLCGLMRYYNLIPEASRNYFDVDTIRDQGSNDNDIEQALINSMLDNNNFLGKDKLTQEEYRLSFSHRTHKIVKRTSCMICMEILKPKKDQAKMVYLGCCGKELCSTCCKAQFTKIGNHCPFCRTINAKHDASRKVKDIEKSRRELVILHQNRSKGCRAHMRSRR